MVSQGSFVINNKWEERRRNKPTRFTYVMHDIRNCCFNIVEYKETMLVSTVVSSGVKCACKRH